MVSIVSACRKSYVSSCGASKSTVTQSRSFSGFRLRMDQAGPRPQARPPVGNIVQALVERSFAWATRCRRLVKDYERYASTLAGFHIVAFVCFMLKNAAIFAASA